MGAFSFKYFGYNDVMSAYMRNLRYGLRTSIAYVLLLSVALAVDSEQQVSRGLAEADIYVKIIGGIIAAMLALLGTPVAYLQTKKTKREIRKLELEAEALANGIQKTRTFTDDNSINIVESQIESLTIMIDPRLRGPLLLLLDFIVAWIILTIANTALNIFLGGPLSNILLIVLGAVLLWPILKEARRVKTNLQEEDKKVKG